MITPKLYGRLGNQAFQISAAIAHARKMGVQWKIPKSTEDSRYWPNYFLNEVPLNNRTPWVAHRLYNEKRHCFDPIPEIGSLTINGYFQSEKYWPTHEDKFIISEALGFNNRAYEHEATGKGYIAVHVRRGDYVSQFSDKHPPLNSDYYASAADYFLDQGFDNFKVYSDDIEWCKKEFSGKLGWNFTYSSIKDPLADMRDMYNASGFIIANSTFSLFPALLRPDNPPVIAPAENRWYGPGNSHLETIDLMPDRFIKI